MIALFGSLPTQRQNPRRVALALCWPNANILADERIQVGPHTIQQDQYSAIAEMHIHRCRLIDQATTVLRKYNLGQKPYQRHVRPASPAKTAQDYAALRNAALTLAAAFTAPFPAHINNELGADVLANQGEANQKGMWSYNTLSYRRHRRFELLVEITYEIPTEDRHAHTHRVHAGYVTDTQIAKGRSKQTLMKQRAAQVSIEGLLSQLAQLPEPSG